MKLQEFKEHYNYAPFELYQFAEEAADVIDDTELKEAATEYLRAKLIFEEVLQDREIELG